MAAGQIERMRQLLAPRGLALVRPRIDEVEREAREVCSRQLERVKRFRHAVLAAEESERPLIQRLHSER